MSWHSGSPPTLRCPQRLTLFETTISNVRNVHTGLIIETYEISYIELLVGWQPVHISARIAFGVMKICTCPSAIMHEVRSIKNPGGRKQILHLSSSSTTICSPSLPPPPIVMNDSLHHHCLLLPSSPNLVDQERNIHNRSCQRLATLLRPFVPVKVQAYAVWVRRKGR